MAYLSRSKRYFDPISPRSCSSTLRVTIYSSSRKISVFRGHFSHLIHYVLLMVISLYEIIVCMTEIQGRIV